MKSFLTKLLIKYRVEVINKNSLEKVSSFYIKKIHVFGFFLVFFLVSFLFCFVFLWSTPLGNKIFDYSKKKEINQMYLMIDSLENIVNLHLDFTNNLKLVLGEQEKKTENKNKKVVFSINDLESMHDSRDSLLVSYIKQLDTASITKYNLGILNKLNVSEPAQGIVTSSFDLESGHFGVDIAAEKNSGVFSILDGVVLFSGFSKNFGNFLIIQHENNFTSIYLHNSKLLKNKGEIVSSGEKIALIGSSGELSSAPHLHFEFWSGGVPIDPRKYLQFN